MMLGRMRTDYRTIYPWQKITHKLTTKKKRRAEAAAVAEENARETGRSNERKKKKDFDGERQSLK